MLTMGSDQTRDASRTRSIQLVKLLSQIIECRAWIVCMKPKKYGISFWRRFEIHLFSGSMSN